MYKAYTTELKNVRKHPNVQIYAPDNELYGFVHETNNAGDTVKLVAEKYYDGPDPIGKTHIREGVVVRIVNRPKFTAFKHKNFDFKVLSNTAIEQAIETGAIEKMSDDEISELAASRRLGRFYLGNL